MKKLLISFLGLLVMISFQIRSARAQAVAGRWDYYNCFNQVVSMTDDGDYFWVSTWGGMVRFKKSDGSYQTFVDRADSLQGYAGGMFTSPNGTVWRWADNMIGWWNGSRVERHVFLQRYEYHTISQSDDDDPAIYRMLHVRFHWQPEHNCRGWL